MVSRDHDCNEDRIEALRMSAAWFDRFITGFVDNRGPTNLDRVCCVRYNMESNVSIGWLDRVALLMPLLVDIQIFSTTLLDIPDLIFSCSKLQHLSMRLYTSNNTIINPVSINLPSLKFLELNGVELHDDFAEKLFMGCPSLERLKLCRCDVYFSGISSQVLKELTLDSCGLYKQMQISCPNLVSLFMIIYLEMGGGISLKNLLSLVNVLIKLCGDFSDDMPFLNLFGGLSNVTNLELHLFIPNFQEQLEKDIHNCINFNNLKKLVVGGKLDMRSDFYLIACLLKHSPKLKELELLHYKSQGQIKRPRRDISGDVLFQYEYLETVKIGSDCGSELSRELINAITETLGRYVKKIGNLIIA